MSRRFSRLMGWVSAAVSLSCVHSTPAFAFCRTTTCDPEEEACAIDAEGCVVSGDALFWRGGRVSMAVDSAGSPKRRITGAETEEALVRAFDTWQSVDCNEGPVSLEALVSGQVSGGVAGYDDRDGAINVNILIYQEDSWDFAPSAVAITTMTFDVNSGRIVDADTEMNAFDHDLTLTPGSSGVDALAVIVHEAGHVFGLAHSSVPGATMQPEAAGVGFTMLRSLEADDEAGICAVYPPDDSGCGCRVVARPRPPAAAWVLFGVLGLAALRRRHGASRRR